MGTFEQWVDVVAELCMWFRIVWGFAALSLKVFKPTLAPMVLAVCRFIFHEGKVLYLPSLLVTLINMALNGWVPWLSALMVAYLAWLYSVYKDADDDDDRWKRRKKKVSETVKALGGKLVVAPAGSGV